MKIAPMTAKYACVLYCLAWFCSCSAPRQISIMASRSLLKDSNLIAAHTGISIFDPEKKQFLYNRHGADYFVPASNVKIMTCYAALKYLKHILPGIRYYENDSAVYLSPTGDPSLLHRDFKNQPVIQFLQRQKKNIYITDHNWKEQPLGRGWAWEDYNEVFMTERNALPVYGNTIRWIQERINSTDGSSDSSASVYSDPEINWKVRFSADATKKTFNVQRDRNENVFYITEGREQYKEKETPFVANGIQSAIDLLEDTTGKKLLRAERFTVANPERKVIWSQPVDSLLRSMMYRSDNFFAEQLLLMASEEKLGIMNDQQIIDTVLAANFSDLPQSPVWVDGSGLSRYNLFTPRYFVAVLDKIKMEFGMEKVRLIFPPGGSGTLEGYYQSAQPFIYAKTGTLSGIIAISGYLYTKKNRLLIFSTLVNNHRSNPAAIRRSIEHFLNNVRARY